MNRFILRAPETWPAQRIRHSLPHATAYHRAELRTVSRPFNTFVPGAFRKKSTRPPNLHRTACPLSDTNFSINNPRPIRFERNRLPLHSSSLHTALVLIAIAAAATAYLNLVGEGSTLHVPVAVELQQDSEMASTEVPSGHLGNLSSEQEEKLRQFWQAIGNVCGWSETGSAPTKETTKEASNVTAAADSGKWGFSLFRKTEDTSAASASGNSAEDDKFGLTKQFDDVLAKQSAESIRQTIWSMVKHDHPDALALRFLRARKWDVQKALVMFIAAMNWRDSEMHVDDDIMKQGEAGAAESERGGDTNNMKIGHDFMEQIRMGKSFLHGNDREGRPICVVRVRLHRNGDQCAESIERYTVHIIETARLLLAPPVETATIVFDMTSFTLANMDYAPVKFMIKCFEANYPESLGAVLIHNAPWVFQGIWRIIRGWLDPVVASKVHFTNGRSGLEQFIEPSKIISELGGDEQWEYKYEEPVDGENKSMEDAASKAIIMEERAGLVKEFEEATKTWIRDSEGNSGKQAAETRTEVARKMRANYWKLDPYVRAKSLYDRQRVIKVGGSIDYYPENAQ